MVLAGYPREILGKSSERTDRLRERGQGEEGIFLLALYGVAVALLVTGVQVSRSAYLHTWFSSLRSEICVYG